MKVFQGNFIHSTINQDLEVLKDHLLGVDEGQIKFCESSQQIQDLKHEHDFNVEDIEVLHPQEFMIPGMVDTHIHAPQYANTGTPFNKPLLEWLEAYTFPTEAKFDDIEFATDCYTKCVRRTLKNGTTTACYYGTIHLDATVKLCDIIDELGQRAYVGKTCMDQNSPNYYIEETSKSCRETESFVKHILQKQNNLITPIITPRFALSCSSHMMKTLAEMSSIYNIPIQTHLSENKTSIELVKAQFPQCKNYTDVYDTHGLLTNKTILAHGVFLDDEEVQCIFQKGAAISHCPTSNINICSGIFDVKRYMEQTLKISLGTDVSAGYHPSIFKTIRDSVLMSKIVKMNTANPLDFLRFDESFYLATLGGSIAMNLEDKIGNFEEGKEFDALLINPNIAESPFDIFSYDSLRDIFYKYLILGDDRNISKVFVRGKQIFL